jgi:hypothetical protein
MEDVKTANSVPVADTVQRVRTVRTEQRRSRQAGGRIRDDREVSLGARHGNMSTCGTTA